MLLTVKTISDLLKRERNLSAIAEKTNLKTNTLARIARNADVNINTNTLKALSDYFVSEFDYMKKCIIELKGE